tara:strand:- start:54 stop:1547 length:1494 start_codon:yes stop_codon:yes gene_type:complete
MDLRTYIKLFSFREFKTITNNGKKFILLILVSTISLWSIGFSSGAAALLKEKMDSPFVKFLAVDIPSAMADDRLFKAKVDQELSKEEIKNLYEIIDYSYISFAFNSFFKVNPEASLDSDAGKPTITATIRPIDPEGGLYSFMKKKSLFIGGNHLDLKEHPFSIVVTEDFLNRLGYNEYPAFINFRFLNGNGNEYAAPIGLAGVVKQLPDKCDILCSEQFYPDFCNYTIDNILDVRSEAHSGRFFIYSDQKVTLSKLQTKPVTYFRPSFKEGKIYEILPDMDPNKIKEILASEKIKYERVYYYSSISPQPIDDVIPPDRLTIETRSLSKVNDLQLFLDKKFQLKLDMDIIESRNNFMTFNSLSKILSNVLVLISIGFIIILIIQTLLEHINRNAKNLGTLKAFGMSNRVIGFTYVAISFAIILIVYFATALIILLSGELITSHFLSLVQLPSDGRNLFNFGVLYSYFPFFTLLPLIVVAFTIWFKIRKETPGDLIYER